jgi:hypothetical protein
MMKVVNLATAAAFAVAAFAVADTAAANDGYDYKEPLGLAIVTKHKKECLFIDKKNDKKYEAEFVEVKELYREKKILLKCIFKDEYPPAEDQEEEDFKCILVLKSHDRHDHKHKKHQIKYTDDSYWELDTYGKGKLVCLFKKDDRKRHY